MPSLFSKSENIYDLFFLKRSIAVLRVIEKIHVLKFFSISNALIFFYAFTKTSCVTSSASVVFLT